MDFGSSVTDVVKRDFPRIDFAPVPIRCTSRDLDPRSLSGFISPASTQCEVARAVVAAAGLLASLPPPFGALKSGCRAQVFGKTQDWPENFHGLSRSRD